MGVESARSMEKPRRRGPPAPQPAARQLLTSVLRPSISQGDGDPERGALLGGAFDAAAGGRLPQAAVRRVVEREGDGPRVPLATLVARAVALLGGPMAARNVPVPSPFGATSATSRR